MLIGLRSRKHIAPFDVVRPDSIEACLSHLARDKRVALMAGGLDLIDRMKAGDAFDPIVSLAGIPELSGITDDGDAVTVGALTTHAALADNAVVGGRLPDLAKLWRQIANARIRQTGTIGGNLISGLAHYDAMPALLALNASGTVADTASGRRNVALNELSDINALLVNVRIPASATQLLADRSLHPSVAVYVGANITSGIIESLRIAVGGAYPRPPVVALPVSGLGQSALGEKAAMLAQKVVDALPEPMTDGLASCGYRRRMIGVLTRRLLVRLGAST